MDPNTINSMMNTNVISMLSLRNDVNIYQILFSIILMNVMGFLPTLKQMLMTYMKDKLENTKEQIKNLPMINPDKKEEQKEIISSIRFVKNDKDTDIIFNSINYYISNHNNSKFLNYNNDFSVINKENFEIADNIFCCVETNIKNIKNNDENETNYTIEVFSYSHKLSELKQFIDTIKQKYIYEQKNKLGLQKFYFDEIHVSLMKDQDGALRFDRAPKNLSFTMTPFHTNKSLSNVFGKHLDEIKDRVHMFLTNKEWYSKKGVPYTLGIMLHGPPGTGKTSLIKAIAKDSNRHVFNIKLSRNTTQTQLRNLFFNEKVDVTQNGRTESFNIPINERLYVIEDIDCLTDVLNQRHDNSTYSNKSTVNNITSMSNNITQTISPNDNLLGGNNIFSSNFENVNDNYIISDTKKNKEPTKFKTDLDADPNSQGEALNLSFVLNLLDGILETPGRILIVTSNHPEKLDKAFLRPGRIDINIKVGFCDIDMIIQMFSYFYQKDCSNLFKEFTYKTKITPAFLNKIILSNYKNPEKAYEELCNA